MSWLAGSPIIVVAYVIYAVFQQKVSMQRTGNADGEAFEYCQWEIFNASCDGSDEVVLMNSARYGRMRFGRCMKEDHGNAGCAANVLLYLDRICSGRRNCQLNIPDLTLHNIHPCPKELMPYLEASYSCIQVQTGNPQFCALYGGFAVDIRTTPVGFLASVTAIETSVGFRQCPWSIVVRKGQKINLTLYSFTSILNYPGPGPGSDSSRRTSDCDWTVEIQESNLTVQIPGCIPTGKEKLIYTSKGGSLKVHLQTASERTGGDEGQAVTPNIIIKYQVFGCADISASSGTSVRRHGDTMMVTCLSSGQTDALTCFNGQWIGESINCSKGYAIESSHVDVKNNNFPYGLFLVVGVGILMGVILGVIMFFTIIVCLRRRRERRLRSQTTDPLLQKTNDSSATDLGSHGTIYVQRQRSNSNGTLCPYHQLRYHPNHLHLHHHHSSGDIIESDGGTHATIDDVRGSTPYPHCVVDAGDVVRPPGSECIYERWITPRFDQLPRSVEAKRQTSTFTNDVMSTSQKNDKPRRQTKSTTSLSDGCRSPGSSCGGPIVLDVVRGARTSKPCPHHFQ